MECKSVKISEHSLEKIRKIGEEVGKPTDDTAIRYILDDREKLKIENELLKMRRNISDGFYLIRFDIGAREFGKIDVLVKDGVLTRSIMDMGSIPEWARKKLNDLAIDIDESKEGVI